MRVLVTGARGFVGRHLVAHLRERGDEIVEVDREVDVTDGEAMASAVAEAAPEAVCHLAALSHVGDSWRDPEAAERVNVGGTAHLLAALRHAGLDALTLLVSSAEVYGIVEPGELPLTEARPPRPVSPYGRSKLEAEQVAREAARQFAQRVVVARPFNHVGPGQARSFVVPALISRLLEAREEGRAVVAVGDLSARRDFTDVRDVVRAYRGLLEHGRPGETYHVASGHDVAIGELATELVERLAPGVRLEVDPALVRPVEVPVLRGDASKLARATGWSPRIPLSRSLEDVIAEWTDGRTL